MNNVEEAAVVQSVARFLADPVRSRNVKDLSVLTLSPEAKFDLEHVILGSKAAVGADCAEFRDAQKPNFSVLGINCGNRREPNSSIVFPEWVEHSQYSLQNPPSRVIEDRNVHLCRRTAQEALALLYVARIVGCRSRLLGDAPGVFPYHKFVGELRIHILRMLAPHLDDLQFVNVLRWACSADTIGHCCSRYTDTRAPMEPVLEVSPWTWDNCPARESHASLSLADSMCMGKHGYKQAHVRSTLSFLESTGTNVASIAGL